MEPFSDFVETKMNVESAQPVVSRASALVSVVAGERAAILFWQYGVLGATPADPQLSILFKIGALFFRRMSGLINTKEFPPEKCRVRGSAED